jgi:hypothetical protein
MTLLTDQMKTLNLPFILFGTLLIFACNPPPSAEIIKTGFTTQLTGSANDGDSTTPADRYCPPGMIAMQLIVKPNPLLKARITMK